MTNSQEEPIMIYTQLLDRIAPDTIVRVGVIGAGQYATAVVTQSRAIRRLDVAAIADVDLAAARRAYRRAGYADEEMATCDSLRTAVHAMERGQRVVVADAMLLMEMPLDVIVEATGAPEAGARHAHEAIRHGKHVAMVSKEPDSAVGPILKRLADQAGVVYTAVDGDQHGLLMGLVAWARELGLVVLAAGKARDGELIHDAAAQTAAGEGQVMALDGETARALAPIQPEQAARAVAERRRLFGHLAPLGGFDVTEMTIAANATGLLPDVEALHAPIVRISEIPEVLCPVAEGGILGRRGAIEAITCLRHPYEAGLGGGVFVVVSCANDYSRQILTTKGLIPNRRDSAAVIYRPYHLCGVETPLTILVAALLRLPTGAVEYIPRVDIVARARRELKAGEIVGDDHSPALEALMRPAQPLRPGNAVPLHMASGWRLLADVPADSVIPVGAVAEPAGSALWALRREQDRVWLRDL
ncbi:MAG: flagellar biosynthesis protein FlgA [Chloroflexota bacterium]